MKEEKVYLYGKHALREVLAAKPGAVQKVFLDQNALGDKELASELQKHSIVPSAMKQDEAKKTVGGDAVHQGVIALIHTQKLYTAFADLQHVLKDKKNPCIVVLNELHDPHNVGAIIRSAKAFGADAIILPEHNQAPITGTVIKTSAGMVFKIPIVQVGNINQTLRQLKDTGFWVYGLIMEGTSALPKTVFDTPTVFVIGNESTGIREKTLELCDVTLSIPMAPGCESLNAATAVSIVLYEWSRNNL